jgi:hypothetical protein
LFAVNPSKSGQIELRVIRRIVNDVLATLDGEFAEI